MDTRTSPLSEAEKTTFATARLLTGLIFVLFIVSLVAKYGFKVGNWYYGYNLSTVGYDMICNSGMIAIALCYARLRPPLAEQGLFVALVLGLEGGLMAIRPGNWDLWASLRGVGIGIGLAAFIGLLVRWWRSQGPERQRAAGFLAIALFLMLFPNVTIWAHYVVIENTPWLYDEMAYQIDGLMGFQPSFAVADYLDRNSLLLGLALMAYEQLPLMLVGTILLCTYYPQRSYNNVLCAFAFMGLAGFFLYFLYPAVGVQVMFGDDFPSSPPPALAGVALPIAATGPYPRNCMPSLHMAWILTLFFAVCRLSRTTWVLGAAAVLLTMLSTLYVGHYWIDLVAAFPLALAFMGLTARRTPANGPSRRRALWGGLALLALTLGALRQGQAL
ncbi:MAG TPA: phosphatase PAP2 family protein, partial [Candidatus Nitrosotenuis sp.]|nr:phosphatase PAP2 family protein [Candidatus Nitrosotenuis sp.]